LFNRPPTTNKTSKYVKVSVVSAKLGLSAQTIRALIKKNELKSTKTNNGIYLVDLNYLEDYLSKRSNIRVVE
jgi:hypothetical protein